MTWVSFQLSLLLPCNHSGSWDGLSQPATGVGVGVGDDFDYRFLELEHGRYYDGLAELRGWTWAGHGLDMGWEVGWAGLRRWVWLGRCELGLMGA